MVSPELQQAGEEVDRSDVVAFTPLTFSAFSHGIKGEDMAAPGDFMRVKFKSI